MGAMISVLGIFAAEVATGKDAMEQLGLFAVRAGAGHRSVNTSSFAGCTMRGPRIEKSRISAAAFKPAEQVGAMAPLGFFDPLGFTKVGAEEGFANLRAAELKHGRVAMMASVGAVVQHFVKFPFAESTHGTFTALLSKDVVQATPWLLIAAAALEGTWTEKASKEPGNFGDPLGLNMYSDEMRSKELNNGRMAMISVLGIFAAEVATGKDAMEQFGF